MPLLSDWRFRGGLAVALVTLTALSSLWFLGDTPSVRSKTDTSLLSFRFPWQAPLSTAPDAQALGRIPLFFEENQGQLHRDVKYLSHGAGYTLFLTANEAVFQLANQNGRPEKTVLRTRLLDANPHASTQGEIPQPGRSNYFIGNQPKDWHTNIPNYGKVRYQSVYPGVDLVYYGNQGQLEYDFIVQPGANPNLIRMRYEGAKTLHLDAQGNLQANTASGAVTQFKPVVYQDIGGLRHPVDSRFVIAKNDVSFELGAYDTQHPLVIDPVLVYSTFLGGDATHSLNRIVVDTAGNAYIAGFTGSTTYPQANPLPGSVAPGSESATAMISKLSANGSQLLYSTYLGGTGISSALALGLVPDGSVYIAGNTTSTDFPTVNAFQATNKNSKSSAFLTRLDPSGQSIAFSTYLSGSDYTPTDKGSPDLIRTLAVRTDGGVVVAGQTGGKDFPTTAGALAETQDTSSKFSGFISSFSATGSLQYSTYLGGSANDTINAIALDASNRVYITGSTDSTDFPSATNTLAGSTDAFYARLSADGSALEHANYFGGANADEGRDIALNSSGAVWIVGNTNSPTFPILPDLPANYKTHSESSAFLSGMQADGTLFASNILGKVGTNTYNRFGYANAIAIDSQDNIFVAGFQFLPDIDLLDPITTPAFPAIPSGQETFFLSNFVSKLQSNGITPIYSTDLRGNGTEVSALTGSGGIQDIALDHVGALYVTGSTQSTNFPTVNAYAANAPAPSAWNGFVAKIGKGPKITLSVNPNTIAPNGNATLSWSSSPDAVSCKSSGYPGFNNDPETTSGGITVTESVVGDHVYTLSCDDADGNTSTAFTTLHVAGPPQITMGFNPAQIITGQDTQLTWSALDATSCEGIAPASFVGTKSVTGSLSITGATVGANTYTLKCTGIAGNTTESAVVTVYEPPTVDLTVTTPVTGYALSGESISFAWTSANTNSCAATGDLVENGMASNGSRNVTAGAAGTLSVTLTCTGPTGMTAASTKSVSVYDAGSAPVITLTSNRAPSNTIMGNQTATLTWTTSNTQSCSASTSNSVRPESVWNGAKPINGLTEITPTKPIVGYGGSTMYTLTCFRPGGGSNSASSAVIVVVNYPRPTHSVTLDPATVVIKKDFVLTWSSTDAESCEASGNDLIGATPLTLGTSGSHTLTAPATAGTYRLWLRCQNHDGAWDNKTEHTLTVTDAPTPTPADPSGSSGGPIDFFLLGGIGLLGLRLRQRQAA